MKRITVFVSRYCLPLVGAATVATTIIAGAVFILHGLIVRLMDMFSSPGVQTYYLGVLEGILILIPMTVGGMFMAFTRIEKTNRTAELLFGTPLSVREYMFSFWFCLVFCSIIATGVIMGLYVVVAGIEHLKDAPPLIWVEILPAAITWVSAGGLLARILMMSSLLRKILYGFIVFLPLLLVTAGVMILTFSIEPHAMGIGLLPSWALEFLPTFIDFHWARWLPTAIYTPLCFFLLIRKIDVRSFMH
ncbi:ABC transporter permease [Dehalococcoidia bacterium]|nr:ABC transporter permease [Dehalococcoidia bacterium]